MTQLAGVLPSHVTPAEAADCMYWDTWSNAALQYTAANGLAARFMKSKQSLVTLMASA